MGMGGIEKKMMVCVGVNGRMGMYGDMFAWRFRFMKGEWKRKGSGL